ncbi:acyl-CoA synthetase (AMP-forming)/AMP-acid ligase II [Herbaspirillum sp. Sphag1AN]|uniref:class I adenylate-forming enzyme family protein n=1 Tax=unclassified Herbaspirillum TaxID=2624150 RepID=UPI00183DFA5E|nr:MULTISPECIES: class I adenylate-forming enzyme family protein [unclassified Herbaspirillum]MBB3214023.1 acyl-CoA synthetase (AMP-forming)/AMP-acid ligase II [Herbaspirillum sp. Sphag1AN]MBB3247584.1 acyl-CoA synthetase (AMP-forming)/AMP-acid ligase II [Herbaspirillum sp. Sphag64]
MMLDQDFSLADLPQRLSDIARYWAQHAPTAPALSDGIVRWNYAELNAAVDCAIALLHAQAVRPGDRVMIVGENCGAQVALILACAAIDAWAVIVNARLSAREVDVIADHCGARRSFFMIDVSADAKAHAERLAAPVHQIPLLGALAIGACNADCLPEPVVSSNAEQVAALIYTSGTTGQPKGVMLTHRNLLFVAAMSAQLRRLTSVDRVYGVLPLSHVFGLSSVMLASLLAGAYLQLAPRYSAAALLHALQEDGITVLSGVPAMYARLLDLLGHTDASPTFPQLRFAYAGGSPMDLALKTAVEKLFGQPLHNGYGLTESSPSVSLTRIGAPRSDTSVGQVIKGVEIRLVDSSETDVASGEVGELWIRGPNVMRGYYRAPEQTASVMRADGWLNTGDLARQDADGALFIVGRTKELIIRSGFNVYPIEVEAALNAHAAISQSAVVGRKVADGNEEVVAFVELVPQATVTVSELDDYLQPLLSAYKRPSEIIIMPTLPAAPTGKLLKGKLRQLAQER